MARRFRQFFESLIFAGLRPNAPRKEVKNGPWSTRLRARVERFLAGRAPNDPLYLSNRSTGQKIKHVMMVAGPCLLLAGALALALNDLMPRTAPPPREPTPAEIVAKLLPDLDKTVKIDQNPDFELLEVQVERGGSPKVAGLLRNRSSHPVSVEIELELTDDAGSRVGAVAGRVNKAPAKNTTRFEFPITQKTAAFALVREMRAIN